MALLFFNWSIVFHSNKRQEVVRLVKDWSLCFLSHWLFYRFQCSQLILIKSNLVLELLVNIASNHIFCFWDRSTSNPTKIGPYCMCVMMRGFCNVEKAFWFSVQSLPCCFVMTHFLCGKKKIWPDVYWHEDFDFPWQGKNETFLFPW